MKRLATLLWFGMLWSGACHGGTLSDDGALRTYEGTSSFSFDIMELSNCLFEEPRDIHGLVPAKCSILQMRVLLHAVDLGNCIDTLFRKHQIPVLAPAGYDYPNLAKTLFRDEIGEDFLVSSGYQDDFRKTCLPPK